jgi:hypothetical protein
LFDLIVYYFSHSRFKNRAVDACEPPRQTLTVHKIKAGHPRPAARITGFSPIL